MGFGSGSRLSFWVGARVGVRGRVKVRGRGGTISVSMNLCGCSARSILDVASSDLVRVRGRVRGRVRV